MRESGSGSSFQPLGWLRGAVRAWPLRAVDRKWPRSPQSLAHSGVGHWDTEVRGASFTPGAAFTGPMRSDMLGGKDVRQPDGLWAICQRS